MKRIKGLNKVLKNLNKELGQLKKDVQRGLWKSALLIKADSVKNTPIDLGNLRNSAFVLVSGMPSDNANPAFSGKNSGKLRTAHKEGTQDAKQRVEQVSDDKLRAIIGYTAYYAIYVHEIDKNYTRGGWQFLRNAITRNEKRVKKILVDEARR